MKVIVKKDYYKDGKIKQISYYLGYNLHNVYGPALILYNKNGVIILKIYSVNGKKHRTNGAAVLRYNHNGDIIEKTYFIKGKIHRLSGPAYICMRNGKVFQYRHAINGKTYSDEDFEQEMFKRKVNLLSMGI